MSKIYVLLAFMFFSVSYLQAQNNPIPQVDYDIIDYSSENGSHPIEHAFDNDTASYWELYDPVGFGLPAFTEVDFLDFYDVNGFSYLPNASNSTNKAIGFELYLSDDGDDWGNPEIVSTFDWDSPSDVSRKYIDFGAVNAEYVRLVFTSSQNSGNGNIHSADIVFYQSDEPASGQSNQVISFDPIVKMYTEEESLELSASANSGLDVSYEILSGPATIDGNTLTLSGEEGFVEIRAFQEGNVDFYPTESIQTFEVVDLSLIYPIVMSRLTDVYPIEMPDLHAYPIYISTAIDEGEQLSISEVSISINGESYEAIYNGRYYYYLWTPDEYGEHNIVISSTSSNGNSETITRNVEVTDLINDQNIQTLEDVVIEFGGENSRWYYGTYTLPQHIGAYDQIIAYLTIECPDGDCDDWDRLAYIDVKDQAGNWIQIIRYITPYGVACDHSIDISDYAGILQGEVEFRMFIDTWGTGGWQVSLELDHQQGTPDYLYTSIFDLWDGTWDLGNPANQQPVDTVHFHFETNVESAHLRLSTTGHGWGTNNYQNAAEFYHAFNYIDIDSVEYFTQDLWNYCDPNPDNCSPQNGTWTYNRAGWCPGAISPPNIVDLSDQLLNDTIQLTYRFAPTYIDFCHPNNPFCVSGVTCEDCNDGYNPHYVIDAHIVSESNSPIIQDALSVKAIDNTLTYSLELSPNPSNGHFKLRVSDLDNNCKVRILSMTGQDVAVYYFTSKEELEAHDFDLSSKPSGVYFINIENKKGSGVKKLIIQ